MRRPTFALATLVAFAGAAFGGRTALQVRRHGDSGWRMSRPRTPADATVQGAMVASALALTVAPLAARRRGAAAGPTSPASAAAGGVLAVGGGVVTLVAQGQMGASWRIGVDPDERTGLVRGGLYGRVRNPIFTGMLLFALGEALLVPNRWGLAGAALLGASIEGQVRRVEEPYLLAAHGDDFRRWAATTGRFVPGVGCLR